MSMFFRNGNSRRIELRSLFNNFFHNQATGGVILLLCTIVALTIANNPDLSFLHDFWYTKAGLSIGGHKIEMTLLHWINDGLMAIFFFVVGLEIKREMLVGELSSIRQAILPIFAAVGGMVVPAIIYSTFNINNSACQNGWGIPMATDIAFSLGLLSLLGRKVPVTLKVFLTALAIVDDLGAIVVLAIFYPSHAIDFTMMAYAGGVVAILATLHWLNVHKASVYIVLGVFLWFFVLGSGIHATIAGVLLAMFIPYKTPNNEVRFYARSKYFLEKFKAASSSDLLVLANPVQQQAIHSLHNKVKKINPLMHRFEHSFHPWVTFAIMPVFALANAGVIIDASVFTTPIPTIATGIFFGLTLGKPLGIFLASWIACKLKFADLPVGVSWSQIFSIGIIAGIGFTMSIFIDNLAFYDQSIIDTGKASILIASLVAAVVGLGALLITTRDKQTK